MSENQNFKFVLHQKFQIRAKIFSQYGWKSQSKNMGAIYVMIVLI